jgi:hypothetical protein
VLLPLAIYGSGQAVCIRIAHQAIDLLIPHTVYNGNPISLAGNEVNHARYAAWHRHKQSRIFLHDLLLLDHHNSGAHGIPRGRCNLSCALGLQATIVVAAD